MNIKNFSCKFFNKIFVVFFLLLPPLVSANICNRTLEIQHAIINDILYRTGKKLNCREVSAKELSQVKGINVHGALLESLKPEDLVGLVSLENLNLSLNRLKSFPAGLETLVHLKRLDLSRNHLSGSLPPSLGKLENLEWLYLFENELSGPLPASLGNLKNLIGLYLGSNQFIGPLPPDLDRLGKLRWLDLYNNHFSGSLPSSWGKLNLEGLYLNHNRLSGTVPFSWQGLIKNLINFDISNNSLDLNGLVANQVSLIEQLALRCATPK